MSSEDGRDVDHAQGVQNFLCRNVCLAQSLQRAGESTWLRRSGGDLRSPAATLAVVRLGQIHQFEVEGERTRHEEGLFGIPQQACGTLAEVERLAFALRDRQQSQSLY